MSNPSSALANSITETLPAQLAKLHLSSIARSYRTLAQQAEREQWPYERYLAQLIADESDRRTRNRLERRLKEARFPLPKELADFDFDTLPPPLPERIRTLAQGHYIPRAEPVILVGNPGLGKTHIAIALGRAACRQDRKVRFYNVTSLINELHAAQQAHTLPAFFDKALRHQLIILDEFGYVPFSTTGAQLLFQFCAALHERTALMLTTNLPFGQWVQLLGDERLTSGLLDRLTYQAHILEFRGDSYRFQHAQPSQPENEQTADGLSAEKEETA